MPPPALVFRLQNTLPQTEELEPCSPHMAARVAVGQGPGAHSGDPGVHSGDARLLPDTGTSAGPPEGWELDHLRCVPSHGCWAQLVASGAWWAVARTACGLSGWLGLPHHMEDRSPGQTQRDS